MAREQYCRKKKDEKRAEKKKRQTKRLGKHEQDRELKAAMEEAERYKRTAKKYMTLWKDSVSKRRQSVPVKEAISKAKSIAYDGHGVKEIDRNDLNDVEYGTSQLPKGKGVFGTCYLKTYQGNFVAVKEFRRETSKIDVLKEASILHNLSHSGLPIVLGIDVSTKPWLMVSLFYGINQRSTTLYRVLNSSTNKFQLDRPEGLSVITQLSKALKYIHDNGILHNDLKTDNVMIANDSTGLKAIIIDFGKACSIADGETKHLSGTLKKVYREHHSHIAPEIVDGLSKQSPASDVFSLGKIIFKVGEFCKCEQIMTLSKMCTADIAKRCAVAVVFEECEHLMKLEKS